MMENTEEIQNAYLKSLDDNLHSYSVEEQREIEKAIFFLTEKFLEKCNNKKPVLLHSIRVGIRLQMNHAPFSAVLAGYLHDVVEDSNCTAEQVAELFGKEVAELVSAATFDKSISDYKERWHDAVYRLEAAGKNALLIKIVDSLDNINYYPKILDPEMQQQFVWKMNLLEESFEKFLPEEKILATFKNEIKELK